MPKPRVRKLGASSSNVAHPGRGIDQVENRGLGAMYSHDLFLTIVHPAFVQLSLLLESGS